MIEVYSYTQNGKNMGNKENNNSRKINNGEAELVTVTAP